LQQVGRFYVQPVVSRRDRGPSKVRTNPGLEIADKTTSLPLVERLVEPNPCKLEDTMIVIALDATHSKLEEGLAICRESHGRGAKKYGCAHVTPVLLRNARRQLYVCHR
jgi:hypothetical protein